MSKAFKQACHIWNGKCHVVFFISAKPSTLKIKKTVQGNGTVSLVDGFGQNHAIDF